MVQIFITSKFIMTSRLKRKLGEIGVDTSSRKANENFCLVCELSSLVSFNGHIPKLFRKRLEHLSHLWKSRRILENSFHCGSKKSESIVSESCSPRTLNLNGQVRDEKGRKRLHGAFTGGWSAGYFNTVGSKEGMFLED